MMREAAPGEPKGWNPGSKPSFPSPERPGPGWGSIRLHSLIALAFGLILVLSGGGLVWLNRRATLDLLDQQVDHQFDVLARGVTAHVSMQLGSADALLGTLAMTPPAMDDPERAAITLTHILADIRKVSLAATTLATTTPDGHFVETTRLAVDDGGTEYRLRFNAPSGDDATETILELDRDFRLLSRRSADAPQDPRTTPPSAGATDPSQPMVTAQATPSDVVLSRRAVVEHGQVFNLTVQLAGLSAVLRQAQIFDGEHIALLGADGMLLADSSGLLLTGPIGAMTTRPATDDAAMRRAWALDAASLKAYQQDPTAHSMMLSAKDGPVYASVVPFDVHGTPFIVASSVPTRFFQGPARQLRLGSVLIQAGIVAVAGLIMAVASRTITRPIDRLASDVEQIIAFAFTDRPPATSRVREIHRLLTAVSMLELTLRTLSTYLPRPFVQDLVGRGHAPALGGTRVRALILFTDIAGFTGIAETTPPDELMERLSRYFAAISDEVLASGGTVDKFVGDGVLAFWPFDGDRPEQAAAACRAVLRAAGRIDAFNAKLLADGYPAFATRFGLHAGEALVGSVGTANRMNYTVLGHAVNIAARIEALNKVYGTRILVSAAVRDVIDDRAAIAFAYVDAATLRGAQQTVDLYRLVEPPDEEADVSSLGARTRPLP